MILQQNMAWDVSLVKFGHKNYFLRILKNVAHLFIRYTIKEQYQCSKMLADNFFEWGNLIYKTGIFLSFTAKNQKWAWGTSKIALNRFFFF